MHWAEADYTDDDIEECNLWCNDFVTKGMGLPIDKVEDCITMRCDDDNVRRWFDRWGGKLWENDF